jgi:drug/metabolite transporter (DMT)-like permease
VLRILRWRSALGAVDLALFATVVLVWGTSWLPLRLQLGIVAPEVSGVWRFALAGTIMFGWLLLAGERIRFGLADHVRFVVLGAFLFSFNFLLAYYGGFYLTSGLLAVVFSLASVINPLLAAAIARSLPEPRVVAGAALGVVGVALLFGPEMVATHASRETAIGLALVFGATLLFCTGNMVSAAYQKRGISVLSANTWCMVYGTLWLALVATLRGEPFIVEWSARYLLSILWLAIPSTAIAFAAYLTLLGRIGAGRAGYSTVPVPVVALAMSTMFEDYAWTLSAALGVVLVLIGNVVVLSKGQGGRRP